MKSEWYNKCLPPSAGIPWNAGWTTNVSVILMDNVPFLLPFRVSKLRTSSQSGCGGCTGMSKGLCKQTSYVIFTAAPNTVVTRGDVRQAYRGKIPTNMQLFILDYGFTSWEHCGLRSHCLFSKYIKQTSFSNKVQTFFPFFHHSCIIIRKF